VVKTTHVSDGLCWIYGFKFWCHFNCDSVFCWLYVKSVILAFFVIFSQLNVYITRMWANAQRDGRPAEHRWRCLLRRKVWLTPSTRCHAVTLPRCKTHWNLQGCLKLPDRSQPLVGWSSPYCGDMWRTYCCLTSFLSIVDTCLSCKDIARQSCAMVPRWQFLATFFASCIFSEPCAPGLCGSMADIQSLTAEISRGKKERQKKIQITWKNIMVCPIT